jgi:hypothetical protein
MEVACPTRPHHLQEETTPSACGFDHSPASGPVCPGAKLYGSPVYAQVVKE